MSAPTSSLSAGSCECLSPGLAQGIFRHEESLVPLEKEAHSLLSVWPWTEHLGPSVFSSLDWKDSVASHRAVRALRERLTKGHSADRNRPMAVTASACMSSRDTASLGILENHRAHDWALCASSLPLSSS